MEDYQLESCWGWEDSEHAHYTNDLRCFSPSENATSALVLGCGTGIGLLKEAMKNPDCHFTGVDMNVSHIDTARRALEATTLDNASFIDLSFEDFKGVERYDYIYCWGVYSSVTPEVRGHLNRIFRDNISPDGLVTITYDNAIWSQKTVGYRNIAIALGHQFEGDREKTIQALRLLKTRGPYKDDKGFASYVDYIWNRPGAAEHNMMQPHWQPLYSFEVAKTFKAMGFEYDETRSLGIPSDPLKEALNQGETYRVETWRSSKEALLPSRS